MGFLDTFTETEGEDPCDKVGFFSTGGFAVSEFLTFLSSGATRPCNLESSPVRISPARSLIGFFVEVSYCRVDSDGSKEAVLLVPDGSSGFGRIVTDLAFELEGSVAADLSR
jgi:hypothetical protein